MVVTQHRRAARQCPAATAIAAWRPLEQHARAASHRPQPQAQESRAHFFLPACLALPPPPPPPPLTPKKSPANKQTTQTLQGRRARARLPLQPGWPCAPRWRGGGSGAAAARATTTALRLLLAAPLAAGHCCCLALLSRGFHGCHGQHCRLHLAPVAHHLYARMLEAAGRRGRRCSSSTSAFAVSIRCRCMHEAATADATCCRCAVRSLRPPLLPPHALLPRRAMQSAKTWVRVFVAVCVSVRARVCLRPSPLRQLAPGVAVLPVVQQHVNAGVGAVERIANVVVNQDVRVNAPASAAADRSGKAGTVGGRAQQLPLLLLCLLLPAVLSLSLLPRASAVLLLTREPRAQQLTRQRPSPAARAPPAHLQMSDFLRDAPVSAKWLPK